MILEVIWMEIQLGWMEWNIGRLQWRQWQVEAVIVVSVKVTMELYTTEFAFSASNAQKTLYQVVTILGPQFSIFIIFSTFMKGDKSD